MKKIILSLFIYSMLLSLPLLSRAAFVEFPVEDPTVKQAAEASYFNSISSIFSFVLALIFIFSIFGFLLSGITFLVSGGNERALDSARKYLISSSVGLLVSLVGYISLNLLKHFF